MNRRSFIAVGTAALALTTQRAFGQIITELSGTSAVSELTGAEVDLGRTGFSFHSRYLDNRADTEIMAFSTDTCDASVRFIPSGTETATYIEDRIDGISSQMEAFETIGTDVFDDGGWMTMSVLDSSQAERGIYMEVQLNAFPGYDLEVYVVADLDSLQSDLELMQQVQVEGIEPFLFVQESGVDSMTFPSPVASPSSRTGRASSGVQTLESNSRGSGTTESNESSRSGTSADTGDPDTAIEAVRQHQAEFMDELDRFYEVVELLGNEDSTVVDEAAWFDELLDLMFSWSAYPDTSAKIVFSSELASLESTYIEWSDGIGEMGTSMSAWMLGEGEIDAFLDAMDIAVQLNSVLSAELRTLGVVIKPVGQGFFRPVSFPRRSLNTYVSMHKIA